MLRQNFIRTTLGGRLFLPLLFFSCSESIPELRTVVDNFFAQEELFSTYLNAEFPPADGFDFPVGDPNGQGTYQDKVTGKQHNGWYVATEFAEVYSLGVHPGEDWNGRGGGSTDLEQPVHSVANGRVITAQDYGSLWGKVVVIEHLFYENHQKKTIHSVYAHLASITVEIGGVVARREVIGTIGQDPEKLYPPHLHLELRTNLTLAPTYWPSSDGKDVDWVKKHYLSPTEFINSHRTLFVPQEEKVLVLIDHQNFRMTLFKNNTLVKEYDVSFGQGTGRKRIEGDRNTPKGMYFIVEKEEGDIPGPYGPWFGGYWMKLNYPNAYDAAWGKENGLITEAMERKIAAAWRARKLTSQETKLGSGIGLHGWIKEWSNDGSRRLSWGCIVLHNREVGSVYKVLPKGTMVVIL